MSTPVVIAKNGLGAPVRPVDKGAPAMTVADNGFGAPIVISDLGAPFAVSGLFNIDDLFASGEQGVWFDPSPETCFTDEAGTVPAVVGDPVALMLDKSKGLVLGPEMVTNGDFSDGTGWTLGVNWTISGGAAHMAAASSYDPLTSLFPIESGKSYEVSYDILSISGGVYVALRNGSTVLTTLVEVTSTGRYRHILTPNGTGDRLTVSRSSGTVSVTIDNISVRELPGNHATQPVATARPTYQSDGTRHWLTSDLVDDTLPVTLPDLGADATVAYATDADATILTGQTIGAGEYEVLAGERTYAHLVIDRALTAPETAAVQKYMDARRPT